VNVRTCKKKAIPLAQNLFFPRFGKTAQKNTSWLKKFGSRLSLLPSIGNDSPQSRLESLLHNVGQAFLPALLREEPSKHAIQMHDRPSGLHLSNVWNLSAGIKKPRRSEAF